MKSPFPVHLQLPAVDNTFDRLATEQRIALAAEWHGRARSELSVGAAFSQLTAELFYADAHPAVLELAARATHDEIHHAELCRVLASTYSGSERAWPSALDVELAQYPDLTHRERVVLHVASLCCIAETIASQFLHACLAECEGPLLRTIHQRHLGDEINHGRLGWAHLASPSVGTSEQLLLAERLPQLLQSNLTAWRERLAALPEQGYPGHAYPPRAVLLETVARAVEEVVLPGFAHVGVDVAAASEVARHALAT